MAEKFPIYHVRFPNLKTMGFTMVRFAEQYESPDFAGQIFDHETWIDEHLRDDHILRYADQWRAFNLPSYALAPFYGGSFDPLWRKERAFLDLFRGVKGRFYVIATAEDESYLGHELVHALYHLVPEYTQEVRACLSRHDAKLFHERLRLIGYNNAVLDDETNAYHLTYMAQGLEGTRNHELAVELRKIFKRHFGLLPRLTKSVNKLRERIHTVRFPKVV